MYLKSFFLVILEASKIHLFIIPLFVWGISSMIFLYKAKVFASIIYYSLTFLIVSGKWLGHITRHCSHATCLGAIADGCLRARWVPSQCRALPCAGRRAGIRSVCLTQPCWQSMFLTQALPALALPGETRRQEAVCPRSRALLAPESP